MVNKDDYKDDLPEPPTDGYVKVQQEPHSKEVMVCIGTL